MPISNVASGAVITATTQNAIIDAVNGLTATWTSYTPTLTQSVTVTKTVTYAKYLQLGSVVFVKVRLDVTGAGTAANAVVCGLPGTAANVSSIMGGGSVYDAAGAGPLRAQAFISGATTTTFSWFVDTASSAAWGVSPNTALANGDVLFADFSYEV